MTEAADPSSRCSSEAPSPAEQSAPARRRDDRGRREMPVGSLGCGRCRRLCVFAMEKPYAHPRERKASGADDQTRWPGISIVPVNGIIRGEEQHAARKDRSSTYAQRRRCQLTGRTRLAEPQVEAAANDERTTDHDLNRRSPGVLAHRAIYVAGLVDQGTAADCK